MPANSYWMFFLSLVALAFHSALQLHVQIPVLPQALQFIPGNEILQA